MTDLAMHMMDIVQNSIRANASEIKIIFDENVIENELSFTVVDNGCGMTDEQLNKVTDPFFTSRTTRKIGLGVPFLKMTSEQTGGSFCITSRKELGTEIKAIYKTDNIDCLPLGDITGYLMLVLIANPTIQIIFKYSLGEEEFCLDTKELKEEGIEDLSDPDLGNAVREYISENLIQVFKNRGQNSYLC